jgi:GR25 family glycosyltransferase involved in LPS biosynthesis
VRVISLARQADRRAEFARRNGHVAFEFYEAVDGSAMSDEQVVATGLFTPDVLADYGRHGVGCALSHWNLWGEIMAGTEPMTIAEDDAVLRRDFEERAQGVLASLAPGWDMVLWGWNFDSILQVHPMDAVSPVLMFFDQGRLRKAIDAFQALAAPVQAWRLERAFGMPAYTLSPAGARKFRELCFPQKQLSVWLPGFNYAMRNMGIDVSVNAAYPQAIAYACFPPLAATPNKRGGITAA